MCRYDVELFQRIEHLIGKRLPLYPTEEEEVLALMERVSEAQRYAKMVCWRKGTGLRAGVFVRGRGRGGGGLLNSMHYLKVC